MPRSTITQKTYRFLLAKKLSAPEQATLQFLFQQNAFSENQAVPVQPAHDNAVRRKVSDPKTPAGFNAQLFNMYNKGLIARTPRGVSYAYYLPGISEYKEALDYHASKQG
jgi:hypothetical protein